MAQAAYVFAATGRHKERFSTRNFHNNNFNSRCILKLMETFTKLSHHYISISVVCRGNIVLALVFMVIFMTGNQEALAAALARSPANPAITLVADTPAGSLTPQQVQRRSDSLDIIRTGEFPAIARGVRQSCAEKDMPASTERDHARGELHVPDGVDSCLAALNRQARDGALMSLYEDYVRAASPDPGPRNEREVVQRMEDQLLGVSRVVSPAATSMPQRITDAIRAGRPTFEVVNGRTRPVTSGLALDTGFVAAWVNQGQNSPGSVADPARLRAASETCVTQRGEPRTCFAIGYVQGSEAYAASRRSAAIDALPNVPQPTVAPARR